jgi:hypothetical protein
LPKLQPPTRESRLAKTLNEKRAFLHQFPEKSRAVVLDHDNYRPLIQPVVPFGDPSSPLLILIIEGWIKAALETVLAGHFGVYIIEVLKRRQDDLGRER